MHVRIAAAALMLSVSLAAAQDVAGSADSTIELEGKLTRLTYRGPAARSTLEAMARRDVGWLQAVSAGVGAAAPSDVGEVEQANGTGPSSDCDAVICESESNKRAAAIVQDHADNPYMTKPDECWGKLAWATAALARNQDIVDANAVFETLPTQYHMNPDPTKEPKCYWGLPLVARAWGDPSIHRRLTPAAQAAILDTMWDYVRRRSKVSDGTGSVWEIDRSENHDAMSKSAFLLFTQALDESGRANDRLEDGYRVIDHVTAWQAYWKEYFRQRALEGINVEIASPVYGKYTLSAYFNIADFARSSILRRLASDFLILYWADVAQDYLPAVGVRGGAQTRTYKHSYATRGTNDGMRPISWIYGWHDDGSVQHHTNPATLIPAISKWRPPEIVSLQATAAEPHQYISRRPGLGTDGLGVAGPHYTIEFPGGNSNIRRFTWWTPAYVMGTLTLDTARNYTALIDQNRWMGVQFATSPNERVAVLGQGAIDDGRTGYAEITGGASAGCMVVARDRSAHDSIGTRIFVSKGRPWKNHVEENGWLFTEVGDAYLAVRPAAGGWVVHSVADGKMLDLPDMWAPVILQGGLAADYASFDDFRASVEANAFDYTNGVLTYTSEAGEPWIVHARSNVRPSINDITPGLNPAKTYSSPYILGRHGEDKVYLTYPGVARLVLDFSY